MNILLYFLVFSSVGGFPVWKIVLIFNGQDVFLAIFRLFLHKERIQEKWQFLEVFIIALFTVFGVMLVYVNRHDYFQDDENNFYINIFEINLAAILARWGGQMTSKFLSDNYGKEQSKYTKTEFSQLYNVYVNAVSAVFLLIWYLVDFFQYPYPVEIYFSSFIYWIFFGALLNAKNMASIFTQTNFESIDLGKNYSYKMLLPVLAHCLALLVGIRQKFTSFECVDYVIVLVSSFYINSMTQQIDQEVYEDHPKLVSEPMKMQELQQTDKLEPLVVYNNSQS